MGDLPSNATKHSPLADGRRSSTTTFAVAKTAWITRVKNKNRRPASRRSCQRRPNNDKPPDRFQTPHELWLTALRGTCGETTFDPQSYRCHLAILREDDGSYSAIVLNLPGAGSCGATIDEAIDNAREAVAGVIESYKVAKRKFPG